MSLSDGVANIADEPIQSLVMRAPPPWLWWHLFALLAQSQQTDAPLDGVTDPDERKAFEAVLATRDATARLSGATLFLARYPESWLSARAHEVRAKAAIGLGRFDTALADGRQSLRLFPENVLLLAPLANVAAHLGRHAEARDLASQTLDVLDRFTGPGGVAGRDWPRVADELRGSALTVLGRVTLEDGKDLPGAAKLLEQALRLRSDDEQAAYLLARCYKLMGRLSDSAAWLASVARREGGALAARARDELAAGGIRSPERARLPAVAASPAMKPDPPGGYAGSAACQQCHPAQFAAWEKTGMAKMFRPFRPEALAGDFQDQVFRMPDGNVAARMTFRDGRPVISLGSASYGIDYLVGSKWQQAYATRGPDGTLHVLPIQYSLVRRRWINYWESIDPIHSVRADVMRFRASGPATSYTRNCAPCHTSQLRAPGDSTEAAFERASFEEPGVNCEMCHGPAAGHARQPERHRPAVEFGKASARQYVAVCSQCHMQSVVRGLGPGGEMNFDRAVFPPPLRSRPYDQFPRRAFYKDGRFRETTFIVEAFERSRCFRQGGAHCGSCHHPHPADAASNPVSLKYRDQPDERCLQCHGEYRADSSRHTRHAANTPAARCEACHMPRIMNALLFQAASHTIDDIPRADLVARYGPEQSPNACLLCHTDKDARWLASQLSAWPRSSRPPSAPKP